MDEDLKEFLEYIVHYTEGQLDEVDFTLEELSKSTKNIQEKLDLLKEIGTNVNEWGFVPHMLIRKAERMYTDDRRTT